MRCWRWPGARWRRPIGCTRPPTRAGFGDRFDRAPQFRAAFSATMRALGHTAAVEPGRLKSSLAGPYFRWAGVDGMISPFTLEVLGNPDLLPFERAFVAAHEWGHLAGFGDEAEASFIGWVTCMHGDAPMQVQRLAVPALAGAGGGGAGAAGAARHGAGRGSPRGHASGGGAPGTRLAAADTARQLGGVRSVSEGQPGGRGRAQLQPRPRAVGAHPFRRPLDAAARDPP